MYPRPPELIETRLLRRAIAYIRQSSPEQVRENTGSTAVQLELVPLLLSWGYPEERIDLVDEDLGVTGSVPGLRAGFNRILALMRTGTIGLVVVVETSRLIRNYLDFANFGAVAKAQDVLLWHAGHVVDFRDPTSEFVGHFFGAIAVRENRVRAQNMRRVKRKLAEQGHAPTRPPIGYRYAGNGMWGKDPDPAVRNAIQLLFDKFPTIGSATGLARWLRHSQVLLPGKRLVKTGLRWSRATPSAVIDILRNPVYKGEYIFGRTSKVECTEPESLGRQRQIDVPESTWIRTEDHHEPYVSPDRWNEIQRRLSANRTNVRPPLGRGEPLIQGLLRCAIHNSMMNTDYPYRKKLDDGRIVRVGRYFCQGVELGEKRGCTGILADRVDQIVERQLLERLSPPSVVDLRNAATESLHEHDTLVRQRADELLRAERACQDFERIVAQISAASHPRARARLHDRLEDAERERDAIRERHRLNPIDAPVPLGESEIRELQQLVGQLPELWRHPCASSERRKAIVRAAIRRIVVRPHPFTWQLDIQWAGGAMSTIEVLTRWGEQARFRNGLEHGMTPPEVASALKEGVTDSDLGPPECSMMRQTLKHPRPLEAPAYPVIRQLYIEGKSATEIANELNARGYRHFFGIWTDVRVNKTRRFLQREQVPGIEAIPQYQPLLEAVAPLDAAGLSPEEITNRLRQQGYVSRLRRPLKKAAVLEAREKLRGTRKPDSLRNHREMDQRVRAHLREWGPSSTAAEAAARLNAEGLTTRLGSPWTADNAREKLRDLGITFLRFRDASRPGSQIGPGQTTSAGISGNPEGTNGACHTRGANRYEQTTSVPSRRASRA